MAFKLTVDYAKLALVIDTDSAEAVNTFTHAKALLTNVDLKSLSAYVNLSAVDILIDADTKNLHFTTQYSSPHALTVTVSESIAIAVVFRRTVADAFQLTDIPSVGSEPNKADSITMSEAFSRVAAYARTIAETPSLSDVSVISIAPGLADTFDFADVRSCCYWF